MCICDVLLSNINFLIFAVLVVRCSHCRPDKPFSTVTFLTIIAYNAQFAPPTRQNVERRRVVDVNWLGDCWRPSSFCFTVQTVHTVADLIHTFLTPRKVTVSSYLRRRCELVLVTALSSRCLKDKRKIIRTVLCCAVYDSCAQWYADTYEQFLKMSVGLGLGLVFVHLFMFSILCFLV